jgi:hypothetical protein
METHFQSNTTLAEQLFDLDVLTSLTAQNRLAKPQIVHNLQITPVTVRVS